MNILVVSTSLARDAICWKARTSLSHDEGFGPDSQSENWICLSGIQFAGTYTALENTELPTLYTKIDNAERRRRASEG